ncbi:uncharacterized protein [Musca autumnalis]|uniref:uncharacterized protein n=1 Tax=Musca autumnalis TaxID=221902 RepID=UPI003CF62387
MKNKPPTKAHLKERWRQLECSGLRVRLQRITSPPRREEAGIAEAALPPCCVVVRRLTEIEITEYLSGNTSNKELYCPITSPVSSVIEISSDEELPLIPPTPSPNLSPQEPEVENKSPVAPASPIITEREDVWLQPLSTPPRDHNNDWPPRTSYSPISTESELERSLLGLGQRSSTSAISIYTSSPSAESSSSTAPQRLSTPDTTYDDVLIPNEPPNFECRAHLTPSTVSQLKPLVDKALKVHRPHSRYKTVVFLPDGQAFRIYISRRGEAIVIPRERGAV